MLENLSEAWYQESEKDECTLCHTMSGGPGERILVGDGSWTTGRI